MSTTTTTTTAAAAGGLELINSSELRSTQAIGPFIEDKKIKMKKRKKLRNLFHREKTLQKKLYKQEVYSRFQDRLLEYESFLVELSNFIRFTIPKLEYLVDQVREYRSTRARFLLYRNRREHDDDDDDHHHQQQQQQPPQAHPQDPWPPIEPNNRPPPSPLSSRDLEDSIPSSSDEDVNNTTNTCAIENNNYSSSSPSNITTTTTTTTTTVEAGDSEQHEGDRTDLENQKKEALEKLELDICEISDEVSEDILKLRSMLTHTSDLFSALNMEFAEFQSTVSSRGIILQIVLGTGVLIVGSVVLLAASAFVPVIAVPVVLLIGLAGSTLVGTMCTVGTAVRYDRRAQNAAALHSASTGSFDRLAEIRKNLDQVKKGVEDNQASANFLNKWFPLPFHSIPFHSLPFPPSLSHKAQASFIHNPHQNPKSLNNVYSSYNHRNDRDIADYIQETISLISEFTDLEKATADAIKNVANSRASIEKNIANLQS